jgi:hypothetical protein
MMLLIVRESTMSVPEYQLNMRPIDLSPEDEKKLHEADATEAWLCQLSSEFLRQHAGKYIAAKDCRIIASADDYGELMRLLADYRKESVIIQWVERPGKVIYG